MKGYTDLEQSKKLAEILPLESADMVYIKHSSSNNPTWEFNEDFPPMILGKVAINKMTVETLPCWSLTALLNILPEPYQLTSNKEGKVQLMLVNQLEKNYYDNAVNACYEMILKLHELKIL